MRTLPIAALCIALLAISCGRDRSDPTPDPRSDAGNDAGADADVSSSADASDDVSRPDSGDPDMGTVDPIGFVPSFAGLDTTFGRGGLQTFGNPAPLAGAEALWDLELTPEGKIVAFGRNLQALAFARLTSSGSLDATFGAGGFRLLPYGDERVQFNVGFGGFDISDDGRYVFASDVQLGSTRFAQFLGSLDDDGGLSAAFGDGGTAYLEPPFPGIHVSSRVGFQSTGKLVVALNPPELRRFEADGSPDTTFGTDGVMTLGFGRNSTFISSLNVLDDDRLVVGGAICCDDALAVAVVLADGTYDTSFGGTGFVVDDAVEGFQTSLFDAKQTADGKLLVAAARPHAVDRDTHFAIGRYLADGNVDATFGDAGWFLDNGDDSGRAFELAIQSDGKIVAAGRGSWDSGLGGLVRLDPDGSLDTTFDGDGIVNGVNAATGVALQPDEKIVVLARSGVSRFAKDGTFDPSFGTDGTTFLTTLRSPDFAVTAVSDADNRLLVAGRSSSNPSHPMVVRFGATGIPDTAFGDNGILRSVDPVGTIRTLALDGQGRLLVGGITAETADGDPGFRLARLATDGTLDTTFSNRIFTAGPLTSADSTRTTDIAYFDDSAIFVGGTFDAGGTTSFALLKMDAEGNLDTSFGNQGVATSSAITATPFVRVASTGAPYALFADRILKFTPDGQLDAAFGDAGELVIPVDDFAIDDDGSLFVLSRGSVDGVTQIRIHRFDASGSPDTAFAGTGEFLAPIGRGDVSSIVIHGDTIVASGTNADPLAGHGVLVAIDRSGAPVASFGTAGRIDAVLSPDRSSLRGLTVGAAGRLVAVGSAWSSHGGEDFAVIRLQ